MIIFNIHEQFNCMCHVSKIYAANRPIPPPPPGFAEPAETGLAPGIWAGRRMIIRLWGVQLDGPRQTIHQ